MTQVMASSAPDAFISAWATALSIAGTPSPSEWPSFAPSSLISYSDRGAAATEATGNGSFNDINRSSRNTGPPALAPTRPTTFSIGSGVSIFSNVLLPALLNAQKEILLVTCFWATESATRRDVADALVQLAEARAAAWARRIAAGTEPSVGGDGSASMAVLRVRIGLSSQSLWQKLSHPATRSGYVYSTTECVDKLGLPPAEKLAKGGIELSVKSLFFLPLSVLHPKFLVVDRRKAWMPSCNISWEEWLEGCVGVEGGMVDALVQFYWTVWEYGEETAQLPVGIDGRCDDSSTQAQATICDAPQPAFPALLAQINLPNSPSTTAVLLPSPHHIYPRFRPLPWQKAAAPPPTPLNIALLELFRRARVGIFLQTPNLTCTPVCDALLAALARGVDVSIVTSRSAMVLEQLVTSGTTNAGVIKVLVARYRQLCREQMQPSQLRRAQTADPTSGGRRRSSVGLALTRTISSLVDRVSGGSGRRRRRRSSAHTYSYQPLATETVGVTGEADRADGDLEAQPVQPGRLHIRYFPSADAGGAGQTGAGAGDDGGLSQHGLAHTHLKLTVIDSRFVVLGSGNMDRASWYTSQELGLLFYSSPVASAVRDAVESVLRGRVDCGFDSGDTPRMQL